MEHPEHGDQCSIIGCRPPREASDRDVSSIAFDSEFADGVRFVTSNVARRLRYWPEAPLIDHVRARRRRRTSPSSTACIGAASRGVPPRWSRRRSRAARPPSSVSSSPSVATSISTSTSCAAATGGAHPAGCASPCAAPCSAPWRHVFPWRSIDQWWIRRRARADDEARLVPPLVDPVALAHAKLRVSRTARRDRRRRPYALREVGHDAQGLQRDRARQALRGRADPAHRDRRQARRGDRLRHRRSVGRRAEHRARGLAPPDAAQGRARRSPSAAPAPRPTRRSPTRPIRSRSATPTSSSPAARSRSRTCRSSIRAA